ncbi:MAG: pilus assembly protein PilP [Gammaproteobacteria bacterium]|nr:MAG: pilus assembly protein PilP [Gammaproteobacteria bacterium]
MWACLSVILTGCGADNEFDDLKGWVIEVQQRPQGRIKPPPEFKSHATFSYSAAGLRSPFQPPVVVELTEIELSGDVSIKPNLIRPSQYLEGFSFDGLALVGTLNMAQGDDLTLWGLINDGQGGVHRVQEGDFLGKNHGRIIKIGLVKLDVIEIVPSGQLSAAGDKLWIERPRTLVLNN